MECFSDGTGVPPGSWQHQGNRLFGITQPPANYERNSTSPRIHHLGDDVMLDYVTVSHSFDLSNSSLTIGHQLNHGVCVLFSAARQASKCKPGWRGIMSLRSLLHVLRSIFVLHICSMVKTERVQLGFFNSKVRGCGLTPCTHFQQIKYAAQLSLAYNRDNFIVFLKEVNAYILCCRVTISTT